MTEVIATMIPVLLTLMVSEGTWTVLNHTRLTHFVESFFKGARRMKASALLDMGVSFAHLLLDH